ncbi:unnamed protein product [Medioppia subpectinata]|uniref:Uncharacterized protein n=1 Tax=Medioppia subpectinata TaxID=1979941 RepID=A0A7R9KGX8_9ACAR|nr:unnamed protein product [Medioppia subpectinata]CAG2103070.1 unnamed protein product [Medioppia subpectinata]
MKCANDMNCSIGLVDMDIDRIYRILGSAFKRVYGFYVKRPLQRFNVDNRAEKAIDKQKAIPRMAPRHERTDQLFKQITQNNPQFRQELNEKREDLLKRLQTVKVVSEERVWTEEEVKEMEEIKERVRSRLPHSHEGTDIPMHAYVEPHHVPIGRISLIRALDFIGKHAQSPDHFDAHTIAAQHRLDEEEVKNVLKYFKPFYKDVMTDPVADTEEVLGVSKEKWRAMSSFLKPKSVFEHQMKIEATDADNKSTADQVNDKTVKEEKQQ